MAIFWLLGPLPIHQKRGNIGLPTFKFLRPGPAVGRSFGLGAGRRLNEQKNLGAFLQLKGCQALHTSRGFAMPSNASLGIIHPIRRLGSWPPSHVATGVPAVGGGDAVFAHARVALWWSPGDPTIPVVPKPILGPLNLKKLILKKRSVKQRGG